MSCWISSSRVHTTFTGPSTCLAISTARATPSLSSRPAKAAADQVIVHHDLVQRQPATFAAAAWARARAWLPTQMSQPSLRTCTVQFIRLHGRVREERNLVGRLDPGGGAHHGRVHIADVLRHHSRIERRLLKLTRDRLRVERDVRAVVRC